MRLKQLSLAGLLLLASTAYLIAQVSLDQKVTVDFNQLPLDQALEEISRNHNIKFAFDVTALQGYTVTKKIEGQTLGQVLDQLLEGTGLGYQASPLGILINPGLAPVGESNKEGPPLLTLEGSIADSNSGETLPFATIYVPATGKGTTSNADGFFTLHQVPDTATIMVSYLGYHQQEIKPTSGRIKVQLRAQSQQLDEVVVAENVEALEVRDEAGHVVFNPRKLTELPNLGEVDIFRSLQLLPGISATNETSSGLVVRGSTPDQNLILFDGFSVFHVDHFFGVFSAFNHRAIKDVQVFKGGFDATYGGRTSSVVDITGKNGNQNKFTAGLGMNLISVNGSLEVPINKKVSFLFAARRAFTDVIQSGLYQNLIQNVRNNGEDRGQNPFGLDTDQLEPTFYFYDVNAKLTYRPNQKNILSFSLYKGEDNLLLSETQSNDSLTWSVNDLSRWGNTGWAFRWGKQWNSKWYSQVNLSFSEYNNVTELQLAAQLDNGINQQSLENKFELINQVTDGRLQIDTEWVPNDKHRLLLGMGFEGIKTDVFIEANDTLIQREGDQEGNISNLYAQHKWTINPKLNLSYGIRITGFDLLSDGLLGPRAGVTYKVSPKWSIKASWGKYHQLINRVINNDINNGVPDFWLLTDEQPNPDKPEDNIPFKAARHLIAGAVFKHNDWLLDIEGYHKQAEGLLDFIPLGRYFPVDAISGPEFFVGESTAKGVDLLLQKDGKKYTGWIGYSLSKVDNTFKGLNKDQAFPANEDQRHEFKTVHVVKLGKWSLSGTWIYASGKPFTKPNGQYAITGVDGQPVTMFNLNGINTFRLPDYHRLDLSATYRFEIGEWKVETGMSIYNLYDRTNIKFKRFDTIPFQDPVRLRTFDVTMLGITPNLFFNLLL